MPHRTVVPIQAVVAIVILSLTVAAPAPAGERAKARKPRLDLRASPRFSFTPSTVLVTAELNGGEGLDHHVERALRGLVEKAREGLGRELKGRLQARLDSRSIGADEDRRTRAAPNHQVGGREARHAAVPAVEGEYLEDARHRERARLRGFQLAAALDAEPFLQEPQAARDELRRRRGRPRLARSIAGAEPGARVQSEGPVPGLQRFDGERRTGIHGTRGTHEAGRGRGRRMADPSRAHLVEGDGLAGQFQAAEELRVPHRLRETQAGDVAPLEQARQALFLRGGARAQSQQRHRDRFYPSPRGGNTMGAPRLWREP